MERDLHTLEELQQEAGTFITSLPAETNTATLVTLSGELGAGKTSFTQGVAKALGITESVTSPTFVLMKSYKTEHPTFHTLVHIDAYRLSSGEELTPLAFSDAYNTPGNLILLEWPEQVKDALPHATTRITLTVIPEGRHITYA